MIVTDDRTLWFFRLYVRPKYVPGRECEERRLLQREWLYAATVALHEGALGDAIEHIRRAADEAFLLHDFQHESDLLEYVNQLRTEADHAR
jgi:hypothetical protein